MCVYSTKKGKQAEREKMGPQTGYKVLQFHVHRRRWYSSIKKGFQWGEGENVALNSKGEPVTSRYPYSLYRNAGIHVYRHLATAEAYAIGTGGEKHPRIRVVRVTYKPSDVVAADARQVAVCKVWIDGGQLVSPGELAKG